MTKLQELLDRWHITNADCVLVGDGSGTRWEFPVGWAVGLVDMITGHRRILTGAMNAGTINAVELFCYLWALRYHYDYLYKKELPRIMEVHIISDSELTVSCGQGSYVRKSNKDLWALVDFWKVQGYNLHWHHVEAHVKTDPPIHVLMDEIAGQSRKMMELAPSSSVMNDKLD